LVFPASSMAFDRRRLGLRGIPGARAASPTEAGCRGSPRGLHSPPERSSAAGRLSPPVLSWDSSVVPSCQQAHRASTPGSRSSHRSDECHPSNRVPSSWFLPTSTVSSARRSRVCCTPQPDKGSSRFAYTGARNPEAVRRRARMRDTHSGAPRDAVHTLRSLPFADSRTASPRPLPSMSLPSRRSGPTIRFDEAPIRRSGPPRHRGIGRGGSTPNTLQTRQPRRVAKTGERGLILRTIASSSASRPCSVDEVRCRQSHRCR
jgi:hypothetical protein